MSSCEALPAYITFWKRLSEETQPDNGDKQLWTDEAEVVSLFILMRTWRLREVSLLA